MRTHTGNPFREAHGKPMRCFDWIAAPGTTPGELPALIEAAIPGLKLECKTPTDSQNGFVLTSRMPDGSLYVVICLHNTACSASDPTCIVEHGKHDIEVAPALTLALEAALPVKQNSGKILTAENAPELLLSTFGTKDPMRLATT